MNEKHFTILFFTLLSINTIIKLYLSWRNRKYVAQHREQVPEEFTGRVSIQEHQKAADYTHAKSLFGTISLLLGIIVLLIWLPGGMLNRLDIWIRSFGFSQITNGTAVFLSFSFVSIILGLPESIYDTFVLEEKFGFNKTTKKTFIIDMIKQLLLGLVIGIPVIISLLLIMGKLGQYWWLYAWAFLSIFQLTMMWIYPTLIAPIFNKFSELPDGEIKDNITELLKRTSFSYKGLFVMDASKRSAHGNAYFTGFGKKRRIVFFDTLLKTLEPKEAEAVLAHELGHFKHKHILKSLFTSLLFSLIGFYILGWLMKSEIFYNAHFISNSSTYMALMLFSFITPIYTFLITPYSTWRSRKKEYQADKYAAKYSQAKDLISALLRLYKDNASTLTPDPLFSAFYNSHPPALERIQHLKEVSGQ